PGTGGRVFDVKLQGAVVRASYDIFAVTGGTNLKATTLTFTVTASGGSGILLELVNRTNLPALLSAIELSTVDPSGTTSPAADLRLSEDGGATWVPIASGVALDRFGRASFNWAAGPAPTSAATALVRATAGGVQGVSAEFQIAPAGRDFYVNDASTAGD